MGAHGMCLGYGREMRTVGMAVSVFTNRHIEQQLTRREHAQLPRSTTEHRRLLWALAAGARGPHLEAYLASFVSGLRIVSQVDVAAWLLEEGDGLAPEFQHALAAWYRQAPIREAKLRRPASIPIDGWALVADASRDAISEPVSGAGGDAIAAGI